MELPAVLVVDVNPEGRDALASALDTLDCTVVTAATFQEARSLLATVRPTVIATPLRLGAYNGIHLALMRQVHAPQAQVIVHGHADPVLQREAAAAGAIYLVDAAPQEIAQSVRTALAGVTRRWPRARVTIDAAAGDTPVRILDVSYGGLRLETRAAHIELHTPLPMTVGAVRVEATPIWARRDEADEETCFYGATLAAAPETQGAWQALVDAAFQGGV